MKEDENKKLVKSKRGELGPLNREEKKTPFFSFSYSFRSVTCTEDEVHIKGREARLEDGKFETEEFEGTADLATYFNAVTEIQRRFFEHSLSFLKPLFGLLPSGKGDKDES